MPDPIAALYESVLLQEMDHEVINHINYEFEDPAFDHIFGDKWRIVIPILKDRGAERFLNALKTVPNLYKFNPDNLTALITTHLDPKYGKGETKTQEIGIGKLIHRMKVSNEDRNFYLNWFAKYKDTIGVELKKAMETHKYTIILTRSPIDVVRMSDTYHTNYSCHARDRELFYNALTDAVVGGAIAYLVETESLKDIDTESEDFQTDELFSDDDRRVWGIDHPEARIRLRRFVSGDYKEEVALPEVRVYGNDVSSEFYPTLQNFLQEKQPDFTLEKAKKIFNTESGWQRIGAAYVDGGSFISSMLSKYFDVSDNDPEYQDFIMRADVPFGSYGDSSNALNFMTDLTTDPNQDIYDQMSEELYSRKITYHRRTASPERFMSLDYDLELDGPPYYTIEAFVRFPIHTNDPALWGLVRMNNTDKSKGEAYVDMTTAFENLFGARDLFLEAFEIRDEYIQFYFNMNGDNSSSNTDEFDSVADGMEEVHDGYENLQMSVDTLLKEYSSPTDYDRYRLADDDEWEYISLDNSSGRKIFSLGTMLTLANKGTEFPPAVSTGTYSFPPNWFNFRMVLRNYVIDNMRIVPASDGQTTFDGFFESYNEEQSRIRSFPFGISGVVEAATSLNAHYLSTTLEFYPTDYTDITFQIIDFLDAHMEDIRKLLYLHVYMKCMTNLSGDIRTQFYHAFRVSNIEGYIRVFDKYMDR